MGLFSSSSRSTQLQTTNQTDKRVVADGGSLAVSGDQVTLLDGGAIAAAFDFAKHSDQESRKTLADTLGFARDGLAQVESAYDTARGEGTQKNLVAAAAIAAVVIVAVRAWSK